MSFDQIIPVLQLSIGPVILISGVGLVLLSMTNRYGRVIDRSRILAESLRQEMQGRGPQLREQLGIMARRARLLRMAILFTTTSLLLAAVLIISLFIVALSGLPATVLVIILFVLCMLSLIGGLVVFLVDIEASLAALHLEIETTAPEPPRRA